MTPAPVDRDAPRPRRGRRRPLRRRRRASGLRPPVGRHSRPTLDPVGDRVVPHRPARCLRPPSPGGCERVSGARGTAPWAAEPCSRVRPAPSAGSSFGAFAAAARRRSPRGANRRQAFPSPRAAANGGERRRRERRRRAVVGADHRQRLSLLEDASTSLTSRKSTCAATSHTTAGCVPRSTFEPADLLGRCRGASHVAGVARGTPHALLSPT